MHIDIATNFFPIFGFGQVTTGHKVKVLPSLKACAQQEFGFIKAAEKVNEVKRLMNAGKIPTGGRTKREEKEKIKRQIVWVHF